MLFLSEVISYVGIITIARRKHVWNGIKNVKCSLGFVYKQVYLCDKCPFCSINITEHHVTLYHVSEFYIKSGSSEACSIISTLCGCVFFINPLMSSLTYICICRRDTANIPFNRISSACAPPMFCINCKHVTLGVGQHRNRSIDFRRRRPA